MKVEVLTYRDPDGDTELEVFVDGIRVTNTDRGTGVDVHWHDVDPGKGWTRRAWEREWERAVLATTPAAAAYLDSYYTAGADSEHVTGITGRNR